MSDYSTLRKSIENELFSTYTETEIVYQNQPTPNNLKELIKIFVVIADSQKESMGVSNTIDSGAVMVQIFTQKDKGSKRSDELMTIIKGLLVNKESEDGDLNITTVRPIPVQPDDYYHQVNIEARFIFSYHN